MMIKQISLALPTVNLSTFLNKKVFRSKVNCPLANRSGGRSRTGDGDGVGAGVASFPSKQV